MDAFFESLRSVEFKPFVIHIGTIVYVQLSFYT